MLIFQWIIRTLLSDPAEEEDDPDDVNPEATTEYNSSEDEDYVPVEEEEPTTMDEGKVEGHVVLSGYLGCGYWIRSKFHRITDSHTSLCSVSSGACCRYGLFGPERVSWDHFWCEFRCSKGCHRGSSIRHHIWNQAYLHFENPQVIFNE